MGLDVVEFVISCNALNCKSWIKVTILKKDILNSLNIISSSGWSYNVFTDHSYCDEHSQKNEQEVQNSGQL